MPRHPFESPIPRQYGLTALLVVVSLSSVFFWLSSFEDGRATLALFVAIVIFFILAACFSWLFGTPGEIQRQQEEEEASDGTDDDRPTPVP